MKATMASPPPRPSAAALLPSPSKPPLPSKLQLTRLFRYGAVAYRESHVKIAVAEYVGDGRDVTTDLKSHRQTYYDSDLEKALNRVDFFRIFHTMALRFGFDHFGILQLGNEGDACTLTNRLALHDLPSGLADAYDKRHRFGDSAVFKSLHTSSIPSIWKAQDPHPGHGGNLLGQLGFDMLVCIPVASINGARYAVLFLGDSDDMERQAHYALCYDAICAFDYFYRLVLSNKVGLGLTPRETEILRWISHGKTASEIALIVSVSEHTVNSHTATILKKLDVVNRTQMVAKAIREQIIQ